jgi:hypothetical protein
MARFSRCCFEPGISWQIRSQVTSAADLLQGGPLLRLLEETLRNTPISNVRSEDRFARQAAQKYVCHGHTPTIVTASTRHMLNEIQSMHHLAMERFHFTRAASTQPAEHTDKSRSGWNMFVSENISGEPDLKVLGKEWALLPASRRAAYDARCKELVPRDVPCAVPGVYADAMAASPLGLGDESYPLRPAIVQEATVSVKAAHRQWCKVVGGVIQQDPDLTMRDVEVRQCRDIYGSGACGRDWSEDDRDRFTRHKRTLWAIARHSRTLSPEMNNTMLFCLSKVLFARR